VSRRRDLLPTKMRKAMLHAERKCRRNGTWGEWETLDSPCGNFARGWLADVTRAHRNKVFSVLERKVDGVTHLAVSSLSEIRPTWHEMQRIKDDLAGKEATAVEVYPPHDEIVDGANMFHIWILNDPLPFSLCK